MPSPFPGMNPYLENPEFWREVHNRLIVATADSLEPQLNLNYRVAIEKRIYLSSSENAVGIPDVTVVSKKPTNNQPNSSVTLLTRVEPTLVQLPIPDTIGVHLNFEENQEFKAFWEWGIGNWEWEKECFCKYEMLPTIEEGYLEIREMPGGRVITVMEILSPSNKRAGIGRETYEQKRLEMLNYRANLVEIDLLRNGKPMTVLGVREKTDYRILVARGDRLPNAQLYTFNLPQPIPKIPVPLKPNEPPATLDLQKLLLEIYDRARFDLGIDYNQEPTPPLTKQDREWVDNILRQQKRR
ncbi:MAG: DUF4058 family protein [Okeania sp. SIO2H7]|nr:DUF4058 family protein [Okeania sp. SIO2H7]